MGMQRRLGLEIGRIMALPTPGEQAQAWRIMVKVLEGAWGLSVRHWEQVEWQSTEAATPPEHDAMV